jgi:membrane-associated protease RseP (regulator of RpoE activity)
MVSTFQWVLAGILIYTLLAMALRTRGLLPDSVRIQGPITTLHTQRGKAFLDWLARPKRFWRAWGNFGVGTAIVVMVGSFAIVAFAAYQAVVAPTPTALNEPRNVLAIPGVNQFLPLYVAAEILTGLLIGLVVHEGGHGLMCRVEDIRIESMGLALLAFIPIGAFVEPDEESRREADRGGQTRMFAAGVMNNFAVAILAFLLLFGPVAGSIAVVAGVPIGGTLPGSAAAEAGIGSGDVITAVDGTSVTDASQLQAVLAESEARTVQVSLKGGETRAVERSLIVTGAVRSAPLGVNDTIVAVNNTTVHTEAGFRDALADRPVATLTTDAGDSVTAPMGAYASVVGGEPFAEAGAPTDTPVIVTSIDGKRVIDAADVSAALAGTSEGDTAEVVGYVDGERRTWTVTLGDNPNNDDGFLGVRSQPGTSGFAVNDFGVDVYPASAFLGVLGGGEAADRVTSGSFAQRAYLSLVLPFASVSIPGLQYNFAGFAGPYADFYTVNPAGAFAFLGGGVFLLANVLFWTAWINLIIGQFNCIPAYPLDGGHILRTSTEAIVSRLPVHDRRRLVRSVTTSVSLGMLAGLILMIFGPRLFS